ncbi:CBL-interacting serine/threonine-protein kinase 9-like [Quercus suber]|uniref:CBL-interacting serine/threonine-protein kinase 9-like n=1 Tax=Quercus suber TaxID=58331 RepID=UPI0032DEAA38
MSSRKTPATRTRVGKYELGKTVGEGSFAKVKFAKNVENGDNVAIKILDRDQVLRHKMVEHLKREISTMKLIKHPNVVKLFEVMASKSKIYIILEFVGGGELFDKIVFEKAMKGSCLVNKKVMDLLAVYLVGVNL